MSLTFELDLDSVMINQHAKYLGQRSFSLNVIAQTQTQADTHINTHTHTHTRSIVASGRLRWSVEKVSKQVGRMSGDGRKWTACGVAGVGVCGPVIVSSSQSLSARTC